MGFLYRKQLYSLTSPWDLLRFSPLSVTDRIRLGVTGLYGRYLRDWHALERVTAKEWLVRFCGERAFNTVWKPLLVFKFGDRWQEAPATYLWARVKRQGTTRKSSSTELLAYVKGGFKLIIGTLADEVRRMGASIQTSTKVDSIETTGKRIKGINVDRKFHEFDKIISTVPIVQFLKLIDPNVLRDGFQHDAVAYQAAVCVLLVLKERLTKYYWIPAVDSDVSFSGIVETTNLVRREDLGGINLVYLINYVPRESSLFSMEPSALISRSVKELENVFTAFNSNQILEAHVSKAAFMEPIWTLNYSSRMPSRVLLDGSLFVMTTAQLYPEINSTSNCVNQVKENFNSLVSVSNLNSREAL
jgi:protoporphyrinogen oxidase